MLPSLVTKFAPADAKGAATGVYSTSQFLGIFVGGAGGGWMLQHSGGERRLRLRRRAHVHLAGGRADHAPPGARKSRAASAEAADVATDLGGAGEPT